MPGTVSWPATNEKDRKGSSEQKVTKTTEVKVPVHIRLQGLAKAIKEQMDFLKPLFSELKQADKRLNWMTRYSVEGPALQKQRKHVSDLRRNKNDMQKNLRKLMMERTYIQQTMGWRVTENREEYLLAYGVYYSETKE